MTLFASPLQRADEVCPCHIRSDEIQQIIDQMTEAVTAEGITAPQIGIQKRIIVLNKDVYIDPEIIWKSEAAATEKILVRAYDREGNIMLRELEADEAHTFQRAIDYLDGKR